MNQEKIGRFIAKLRKEKNMTQQELANKLNVTDRAIGNWENGRRMPDYSLLNDLCKELNININELLSGEKIKESDYITKAEENFINLKKKVDRVVKVINIVGWIMVAIMVFLFFIHMYLNWLYRGPWDDSNFSMISNVLLVVSIIGNLIGTALTYEVKK